MTPLRAALLPTLLAGCATLVVDARPAREAPKPTPPVVATREAQAEPPISTLHVVVRTAKGGAAGTDDPVELCLGGHCERLGRPGWNDFQAGALDTFVVEDARLSRADLSTLTLRTRGGTDAWEPACVAVYGDGDLLACQRFDHLAIGADVEAGEKARWSAPLPRSCGRCDAELLTHGPMVGAVHPRDARLWVRTAGRQKVAFRVASDAASLAGAEPAYNGWSRAEHDFTLEAAIPGLTPGRTWAYDVEIAGVRFGPWSFSTPPEGPGRRRIAMGSCAKAEEQPIFDAIRAEKPDAFVFLGDNHYGNTADRGALLAHYRAAHATPKRRELLARTPIFATWDDHDFVGNNTDGNAPGKEVALRAFREYWANGTYGLPEAPGVYSAHDLGDVLLVLLDGRYARNVGGPELLGRAQEAWLVRTLKESRATFKLLAIGSQWTAQGTPDSWAAFPAARARLFRALEAAGVGGLVLLSGDIHKSQFREIRAGTRLLPELTASPLTTRDNRCGKSREVRACVDGRTPTFLTMDIDTTRRDPTLTARIVDVEGKERARWVVPRSSL